MKMKASPGAKNCGINERSMVAKLYRLQHKLDAGIGKEMECSMTAPCRECCSRCFCVSETEFFQILYTMFNHWTEEEVVKIIERSKSQWEILNTQNGSLAQKLQGGILLNELLRLEQTTLPFPCIFFGEQGGCLIHEVRPLACRFNGNTYSDLLLNHLPCPKNGTDFAEEIRSFLFLKYRDKVILRRPMPLFFFFRLIFRDPDMIHKIPETECYRNILGLSEYEYIKSLAESV